MALGGIGTLAGPLVGAAVVVTMQQFLAPFGAWVLIIQGAVFAVCVLMFRNGIVARGEALWRTLRSPHHSRPTLGKQAIPEGGR